MYVWVYTFEVTLSTIVLIAFLVLNLPSHISRLYLYTVTSGNGQRGPTSAELVVQHVTYALAYVHYASNFYLYAVLSRSFRNAVRRFFVSMCTNVRRCCQRTSNSSYALGNI